MVPSPPHEMTFSSAFRAGVRRVNSAPAILVGVWLITAVYVLPIALQSTLRPAMPLASLGGDDFAHRWEHEVERETIEAGLDLLPSIRAAVRHPIVFTENESCWMVAFPSSLWYLTVWLFLSGGIIDRYARDRPTRAYGFFAAAGVFFCRFLRLAPVMVLVYGTVVYVLRRWPVAMWPALGLCNLVFDYAQVRAVVEDRRSMLGALKSAVVFLRRNLGGALTLYAIDCAIFASLVGIYTALSPASISLGFSLRPLVWIEQGYVLARLWARLLFWATETALFQGRLAHAGYVAAPPPTWPDSPAAEAISN